MSFTFRPYKPITHPPLRQAAREELVIGQWYKRYIRGCLRTVWLHSVSECGRYTRISYGDDRGRPTHDCPARELLVWLNQDRPELRVKPPEVTP